MPHAILSGKKFIHEASKIGHHEAFAQGANVNFVEHTGKNELKVVTFERGVEDFTLACGTGAIACAIIFSKRKQVQSPVTVKMPGGILKVSFDPGYKKVFLEGPAITTFEGEFLWKVS
ncbi:MAG: hypothetical protein HYS98_05740 [Deltaproteobacteria bacterium]|nr:hypothetical protein [Deltaproteobacteria bacterium]